MKPKSGFSDLRNEIFGFGYAVKFPVLPHHASPFGLCGGSLWYTSPKRWISAKDIVHRFIYAFFKGFTLAELITRRSFPQHLVAYPQVYQHVDNRPRKLYIREQRSCATRIDFENQGVQLPYFPCPSPLEAILRRLVGVRVRLLTPVSGW